MRNRTTFGIWLFLAALLAPAAAWGASAPAGVAAECDAPGVYCGGAVWEYLDARPTRMLYLPLVRQGRDNTCGVACVQSILRYAGYEFDYREDMLIDRVGTDESGAPIAGMVDFLNRVRRLDGDGEGAPVIQATVRRRMTLADLVTAIDAGKPVICLLQAWQSDAEGNYELEYNYSREWRSGHYAIAAGYDGERIYFMDPSTLGAYTYVPRDELDTRWHGGGERTADGWETHDHLGIVVTVDRPQYKPGGFYKML